MQINLTINIDDKIIHFFKRYITRKRLITALVIACFIPVLNADQITKQHSFTAGTTIQASQVNANFDDLFTKVNALDTSVAANTTGVATNSTGIAGNKTSITTNTAGIAGNKTSITANTASIAAIVPSQWTTGSGNISYSGGNVGIGQTSPSEKLEVNGRIKAAAIYSMTNTIVINDSPQWNTIYTFDNSNASYLVSITCSVGGSGRYSGLFSLSGEHNSKVLSTALSTRNNALAIGVQIGNNFELQLDTPSDGTNCTANLLRMDL